MERSFNTIIVGGGVIGLSLARELHKKGVRNIAILDRGRAGGEASWAAAGMLSPTVETHERSAFYELCLKSRDMFPRLAEELLAESGLDIELDTNGTLLAAFSDADFERLCSTYALQRELGFSVQILSRGETLAAEPRLSSAVRGSLLYKDDWQVENRRLVAALKKSVGRSGVKLIEETVVNSLITRSGRVEGVELQTGGRITADVVVLATGAWTSLIETTTGPLPIEVRPVKGQIIGFAAGERKITRVICGPHAYLVPRSDGRILVGATVEDVGFDGTQTEAARTALQRAGAEIAPFLEEMSVTEQAVGFRPLANGSQPIFGPIPGLSGAFVATAHFRNGILLAPVTAKVLAERIVDRTRSSFLERFSPESHMATRSG